MAFTPFVDADLPTMANFNEKFQEAIQAAMDGAADAGVKIATGSYVGTGTYGDRNPNTLTFEFEPKLVIVNYSGFAIFVRGSTKTLVAASASNYPLRENEVSWGVNKVSWYHTGNSENQLNRSGITYFYVAIV